MDQPYPDALGSQLIQRCVIVQRDERGYGLTVSGDNPVFIQSVKDNGAAYRAGVQQGDRIIKVNGTLVTQSNHLEVVKMIRSGPYVALTLLGRPPGSNGPPLPSPHTNTSPTTNATIQNVSDRPKITNPQPADAQKVAEARNERLNTYRNMLEQEKQLYEKTRTEYNIHPTEKLQKELNGIQTRIRVLEQQLQKAYREGAYPKPVTSYSTTDNSDMLADEFSDSSRRKAIRHTTGHTRQRSTPDPTFRDDNTHQSAGLKRNNSDVQSKESVRQKLMRGSESRQTKSGHSRPDLDALGRVRDSLFSKSLGSAPDGSQPDSDMGDSSPASTPPTHRKANVPEGMEGLEDLMNPGGSANLALLRPSEGTIEEPSLSTPQIHILPYEDEFSSDNENFDDHGPFNRFSELEKKPAHMAVFLHYLISNSDPSSLFFYIVTDSYKSGSAREMKKWVYEIFSTFLAQSAPLRIQVEDEVVQSIENTTTNKEKLENGEVMRNVFNSARGTALQEIKELLADFRTKRALGLGSIFGDQQLQTEDMDSRMELKIVEQTLLPHLERLTAEPKINSILEAEKEAKNVAMAAALTTFLKNVGVRIQGNAQLERCQSFAAKEKKGFPLSTGKKSKKHAKGHQFQETHFYNTAFCHQCSGLLWGIGYQGYQCSNCEIAVHKIGSCLEKLEDVCQGKQDKKSKKISGVFGNKTGKKEDNRKSNAYPQAPASPSKNNKFNRQWATAPFIDDLSRSTAQYIDDLSRIIFFTDTKTKDGELLSPTSPLGGNYIVGHHNPKEEDEDIANIKKSKKTEDIIKQFEKQEDDKGIGLNDSGVSTSESFGSADAAEGGEGDSSSTTRYTKFKKTLSRSESLKSKSENIKKRSGRRSRSDVDKDQDSVSTALDASNSNSSSSLSGRSQDSPSASQDSLVNRAIEEYPQEEDSDMEAETDAPNWQDLVDKDMVKRLKPKEVKRQEIINELFYTEKSHVRTLKVLDRVFHKPMLRNDVLPKEMVQALFPNLDELLEVHVSLNNAMKKERRTSHIIQEIGDMLLKRFDSDGGEQMKRVCATFCQNQKAAVDMVKAREKKDGRLEKFIADAESNPLCQRLPLRGLISVGFQRLTKYPLLIENLLKYSQSKTEEYKKLEKVRNSCKSLLAHVNTVIKESENQQYLIEISKKIDKSPLERSSNEIVKEFKNLDITSRKLIHHSPLVWRLSKTKNIELYALLLEDILVLLQKQDEKYILKCHSTTVPTQSESQKNTHSPIILLSSVLCRPVATNKYAFFLVSTSAAGPQIYELVTPNKSERESWMERIHKAQEVCKQTRPPSTRRLGKSVGKSPIAEEEDDQKPSTDVESSKPPLAPRPETKRQISKPDASQQKPEELEILLADSIRAKLPDEVPTDELLDFLVTMSSRVTPLLKDVHEKRSCTKTEENILKAMEIMENKLGMLQNLVVRNDRERLEFQERCRDLQGKNDELEDENSRLAQELSASQHELRNLNETMQQIRGEQPMTNADTNSYESLPTTDLDCAPDEDGAHRKSFSGESVNTTDSEEDEIIVVGGASSDAANREAETEEDAAVKITSNVVTELQPTKAHTAEELFNDGLASLHAAAATGFDKYVVERSREEDDEYTTLGAPPPIPVEQDVNVENRTPNKGEYKDSDMDEVLNTIEGPPADHKIETTQENDSSPSQRTETPSTVHSQQMEQPNSRHSPTVPLEDRDQSNDDSALRNNTEIVKTEGGSVNEDDACQGNEQTNSNEQIPSSPTATTDMQNQTTSAETSSGHAPECNNVQESTSGSQPPEEPSKDDLITFNDDLQLNEDALHPEPTQKPTSPADVEEKPAASDEAHKQDADSEKQDGSGVDQIKPENGVTGSDEVKGQSGHEVEGQSNEESMSEIAQESCPPEETEPSVLQAGQEARPPEDTDASVSKSGQETRPPETDMSDLQTESVVSTEDQGGETKVESDLQPQSDPQPQVDQPLGDLGPQGDPGSQSNTNEMECSPPEPEIV